MIIWNQLNLENRTGSVSATVGGTNTAPIWNFDNPIQTNKMIAKVITTNTIHVNSSLDIPDGAISYSKLTGDPNVQNLTVRNVATLNAAGITNATINGGLVFGENAAPVTLPVGSKIPGTDTDGLVVGNKYTVYASVMDVNNPLVRIFNGSNKNLYCQFQSSGVEAPTYDNIKTSQRPTGVTHFYLKPWEWLVISISAIQNIELYCQTEIDAGSTKPTTPQFHFTTSELVATNGTYKTVSTDFWTDPNIVQLAQSSKLLICTNIVYTETERFEFMYPTLYQVLASIFNLYEYTSHGYVNNGAPINNCFYGVGGGIKQS